VEVRVIFVVVGPARDEQAEDIVLDTQFVRAVGVMGWLASVADAAESLLIDWAGPLLCAMMTTC